MRSYLGDGVYVDFRDGMLELTVWDGLHTLETIYLDSSVYKNLVKYVNDLKNQVKIEKVSDFCD